MELKCVKVWLILMLMFITSKRWRVESCLKQEKSALLQLKHFFNDPYSIQEWVERDEDSSNCCQWEMIECSNTTGRVIGLDLYYARNQELGEWNLNVSLFSPFQELETLDLSDNLIAGCVENEGFERLSHLSNLKGLYLDYNMFNDSRILSALSKHSSLKNLSLAYNHLRELNHFNVAKLNNLEYLDLSGNTFNHNILSYVSTLSSLKELDMYDIGLKGTFDLQELVSLSNLEVLYMGGNQINKIVFSKGDAGLRKLYSLSLYNVSISDGNSLFQTLGLLSSLQSFDLWYCNISGRLSGYEWSLFKSLIELSIFGSIFDNYLFQMFGIMSSLQPQ
ncbi:receptor-like protein 56 [Mangifera indica]|uniref:receptor-like protein 56 n=1 Tax=Mangifera indica TaxID=29780 RepID=UPI001CF997EE|nr:receptor-like protein 56 [Mangifera indica]